VISLPHAGSDQMILQPFVGLVHFSLGSRTQDINHLDALENLLPLDQGLFFGRLKLPPHSVSFLHVAEDRMIIDIVLQRTAKSGQHGLLSHDMGTAAFLVLQILMQAPPVVIVDGGDEIPFGLC